MRGFLLTPPSLACVCSLCSHSDHPKCPTGVAAHTVLFYGETGSLGREGYMGGSEQGEGSSRAVLRPSGRWQNPEIRAPVLCPAPSVWPWRAKANLRRWPQLRRTAPRTATETCCPVSLQHLLTSSRRGLGQHPIPGPSLTPCETGAPAPGPALPAEVLAPPGAPSVCLLPSVTSAPPPRRWAPQCWSLPLDDWSRVPLKSLPGEPGSDYINASFLPVGGGWGLGGC